MADVTPTADDLALDVGDVMRRCEVDLAWAVASCGADSGVIPVMDRAGRVARIDLDEARTMLALCRRVLYAEAEVLRLRDRAAKVGGA